MSSRPNRGVLDPPRPRCSCQRDAQASLAHGKRAHDVALSRPWRCGAVGAPQRCSVASETDGSAKSCATQGRGSWNVSKRAVPGQGQARGPCASPRAASTGRSDNNPWRAGDAGEGRLRIIITRAPCPASLVIPISLCHACMVPQWRASVRISLNCVTMLSNAKQRRGRVRKQG